MKDDAHYYISARFIPMQLAGVIARGGDMVSILHRVGIDPVALTNPEMKLSMEEFSRLMKLSWSELQDESAGVFRKPLLPGTYNMMCHATISSPNLRRAIIRSAKFYSLLSDEIAIELHEAGSEAELRFSFSGRSIGEHEQYTLLLMALIWHRWMCWMIDKKILLGRLLVAEPVPDYALELEKIFSCQVEYEGDSCSLFFSSRYLQLPIEQNAQTLEKLLMTIPGAFLTEYKKDDSISAKVRELLDVIEAMDSVSLDEVSHHLCMSSQTLHRRLKQEGNTFQEIKDRVRQDKACYLLRKTDLPIKDVAIQLGFAESSVFNRAFKKWTGHPPAAYRNKKSSL